MNSCMHRMQTGRGKLSPKVVQQLWFSAWSIVKPGLCKGLNGLFLLSKSSHNSFIIRYEQLSPNVVQQLWFSAILIQNKAQFTYGWTFHTYHINHFIHFVKIRSEVILCPLFSLGHFLHCIVGTHIPALFLLTNVNRDFLLLSASGTHSLNI